MASSTSTTVSLSPKTSLPEWKKMKVQELREVLASKGLETLGLKSSLIERLETSAKSEETKPVAEGTTRPLEEIEIKAEGELSQELSNLQDMIKPIEELTSSGSSGEHPVAEQLIGTETSETVKQIEDRMTPTLVNVPPLQEINGVQDGAAPPSETQKKKRRAERFGVEFQMSEQEKRRLRATRFGATSSNLKEYRSICVDSNRKSPTSKEREAEMRKARAARFGTIVSKKSPSDEDAKKRARLARFGSSIGARTDLSSEEEKKKARAARFGSATKEEVLNGDKKFLEESVESVSHA